MFIRKELVQKIKETIFRSNLQKDLDTFQTVSLEDITKEMVNENLSKLKVLESRSLELAILMNDLLTVLDKGNSFLSEFTKTVNERKERAEVRVNNAVSNLSPATKLLIRVLKYNFKEDSFIVGGFVRDAIANRKSNDVDFCTSISYDRLKEVLEEKGFSTKDTGKQFLVLNASYEGENFEIAALRKDKDNEGAEVGTIFQDAKRRDFTNSWIYRSLKTKELMDPSGMAIKDCQDNVLRFMGNPGERIKEDPLRVMRTFRFIQRGWEAETKTLKAAREHFEFAMKNVSATRVMLEVEKMANLR
jgi:hypothetical protein